jgi:hypothetical protein
MLLTVWLEERTDEGKKGSHPKTVVRVIAQSSWPDNKITCIIKLVLRLCNLQAAIYQVERI